MIAAIAMILDKKTLIIWKKKRKLSVHSYGSDDCNND